MDKKYIYYGLSVILGILAGIFQIPGLSILGKICSEVFVKLFRCISMPVVSLSVIVALSCYGKGANKIWKQTLHYTIGTTLVAASVAAILYYLISPPSVEILSENKSAAVIQNADYLKYFLDIIPESMTKAFIEHKVLSILLISVIFGISIRSISEENIKCTLINFFKGLHNIFFAITTFLIKILPIGLFGFICESIKEMNNGMDVKGMGKYFLVIILANLVQGLIILPSWLTMKGLNPVKIFKAMMPALSCAMFSKSSSGALPVTISKAENNLNMNPKISRFVLPLCTTINMNGCSAFIFSTVIYVMQNYGITIDFLTVITWILIATLAAIGNAGIPMGCFFLSASLLSSMNIPMPLLGIILPIYSIIDMLETTLNVWSDACVASVIDKNNKN